MSGPNDRYNPSKNYHSASLWCPIKYRFHITTPCSPLSNIPSEMVPTICSENPQAFSIAWQTVPSESCIVAQERDTFIFHPKSRGWNHQLQRVQYVPDVLQFAIIDTWINVLNSPAEPALLATSYPWRLHPRVIQGPSQQAIKHSGYLSTKT